MTPADIAMLERAAKAAGYIEFTCRDGIGPRARAANGVAGPWNPLDEHADAMQLAAHFRMRTRFSNDMSKGMAIADFGSVWDTTQPYGSYAQPYSECGWDRPKAMRRAITGAAAAYEPPAARGDWPGPDLTALQSRSRLGRERPPVRIVQFDARGAAAATARKIDDDIYHAGLKPPTAPTADNITPKEQTR